MITSAPYTGPFDGTRLNSQHIEKLSKSPTVEVHSIFHTVQGEGPFCGRPAVFVRLTGCNLQCPMCDTEYTSTRDELTADQVVSAVWSTEIQDGGLVVITGGEPFRQPKALTQLVFALIDAGYTIQIETNGTLPVPRGIAEFCKRYVDNSRPAGGLYIVCSPKTGNVQDSVRDRACCYKYVITHDAVNVDDGLPTTALGHRAEPQLARPPYDRHGVPQVPVYVQPADHQNKVVNDLNVAAAVQSALQFGHTVQLQIHKFMGLE